jgi:hypothetical protein
MNPIIFSLRAISLPPAFKTVEIGPQNRYLERVHWDPHCHFSGESLTPIQITEADTRYNLYPLLLLWMATIKTYHSGIPERLPFLETMGVKTDVG